MSNGPCWCGCSDVGIDKRKYIHCRVLSLCCFHVHAAIVHLLTFFYHYRLRKSGPSDFSSGKQRKRHARNSCKMCWKRERSKLNTSVSSCLLPRNQCCSSYVCASPSPTVSVLAMQKKEEEEETQAILKNLEEHRILEQQQEQQRKQVN